MSQNANGGFSNQRTAAIVEVSPGSREEFASHDAVDRFVPIGKALCPEFREDDERSDDRNADRYNEVAMVEDT